MYTAATRTDPCSDTAIEVLNVPESITLEDLIIYFQDKRNGGCGDVVIENCTWLDEDESGATAAEEQRSALICFEDPQTVKRLLQRNHYLNDPGNGLKRLTLKSAAEIVEERVARAGRNATMKLPQSKVDEIKARNGGEFCADTILPVGVTISDFDAKTKEWTLRGTRALLEQAKQNIALFSSSSPVHAASGAASIEKLVSRVALDGVRSDRSSLTARSSSSSSSFDSTALPGASTTNNAAGSVSNNGNFPVAKIKSTGESTSTVTGNQSNGVKNNNPAKNPNATGPDRCAICLEPMLPEQVLQTLHKCLHKFHQKCILETLEKVRSVCPICNEVYGVAVGEFQPKNGRMRWTKKPGAVPGFACSEHYEIQYDFPDGTHEIGWDTVQFSGATRTAYLPCTPHGDDILKMFKIAFDHLLTFALSPPSSVSAGADVKWRLNWSGEVWHKTSLEPGMGFPDQNYLVRVEEEMGQLGIQRSMVH